MAQVIWTEPAQQSLNCIAEFIELENPAAASGLVKRVSSRVKQLERFPKSGSKIPESSRNSARQLIVKPCRIFYRVRNNSVLILYVMRSEMLFRSSFLRLTYPTER
jgi:plasmid stabilization system protein ParE